jgi:hypothetical protein
LRRSTLGLPHWGLSATLLFVVAMASFPMQAMATTIDFERGPASGGTISHDGTNATGTNIGIGTMRAIDTPEGAGDYTVTDGLLNFDTGTNTITLTGAISGLGITDENTQLLSGSFTSWNYETVGLFSVFSGTGPDVKNAALLTALGLPIDLAFQFFTFAIQVDNLGQVVSVDLANVAVPIPGAAWLFGSALLGVVAVGRRRMAKQSVA